MKKELLSIEAEKAALIEDTKANLARKRGDAALSRARDAMPPDTEDVTIGDAKNESTMTGYTGEDGVFQATKVNSPVIEKRQVPLDQRFKTGLINTIKSGDSEAYAAISGMYENAQKLDKGEADIGKTQAETAAALKGKKDHSTIAEKLDYFRQILPNIKEEERLPRLLELLGAGSFKPETASDPYRETPDQKAARDARDAQKKLDDEELRASIEQEFIDKEYESWKKGNFQHNTVKDFLEAKAPAITKTFVSRKRKTKTSSAGATPSTTLHPKLATP